MKIDLLEQHIVQQHSDRNILQEYGSFRPTIYQIKLCNVLYKTCMVADTQWKCLCTAPYKKYFKMTIASITCTVLSVW